MESGASSNDKFRRISVIIGPNIIEYVDRQTLVQESEFFAGIFRFHKNRQTVSLEEPREYGLILCWLVNCLQWRDVFDKSADPRTTPTLRSSMRCLSTIFDCVVMCSKYCFDRLETQFSELFCKQLTILGSNIDTVLDPILPPPSATNEGRRRQQTNNRHTKNVGEDDGDDDEEQYLNAYEMFLLARDFNLTMLADGIQKFIQNKRTETRNRLRMTFRF